MKKILCAVLALAAMTSCSKEYTIDTQKQAIAFSETFVDNGTRADYSQLNKPVEAFKVYGTLTGSYGTTVQVFNGANVTKPDNYYNSLTGAYDSTAAWICTATQYWVPKAEYEFAAIVDGVAETTTTLPEKIKFTVADGDDNLDLLYATATASVSNEGVVTGSNMQNGKVAFSFDHLLSKVGFTVTNNIGAGYSIKVTGITVEDVAEKGIYNVATGLWTKDGDTETTLTFGNEDKYETRQILPVNQTLAVTIAYDIYYGDVATGTKISAATKSGTVTKDFAKNTVYNITATITMTNKIEFTVEEVNGWNTPVVDAPLQ